MLEQHFVIVNIRLHVSDSKIQHYIFLKQLCNKQSLFLKMVLLEILPTIYYHILNYITLSYFECKTKLES